MVQKNTQPILQNLGLKVDFGAMKDGRTNTDLFSYKGTLDHYGKCFDSDLNALKINYILL
jgi:hypothetical protein